MQSKTVSEEELVALIKEWREAGLKIGFTCGAFDLLHAGHVQYLQAARALCDRLIVAVNSDRSVQSYKNPLRPIVAENFRLAVISALASVDAVVQMDDARPDRLIELLHPDVYIKGGDYAPMQLRSGPLVESYGGRVAVIPVEHAISTSSIVERIEELLVHAAPEPARAQRGRSLVCLDRDGTLIENSHFLNEPGKVQLRPGVGEGLRRLGDAGYRLVMVTNQQGIGLGYFDYDTFVAINSEIFKQLAPFGVRIDKVYFCPHSLAEDCDCRKPGSRLIERALRDFGAPREQTFMIGDSEADIGAAKQAGVRAVLISDAESDDSVVRASDFPAAVELILQGREPVRDAGEDTATRLVQARFADTAAALRDAFGQYAAEVAQAAVVIGDAFAAGGKLLAFGNGGSASDAQHLCGELVVRFQNHRRALPAISLCSDPAVLTACGNDYSYRHVFARQVEALGNAGDIAAAISTSGESENVIAALQTARERGLRSVLFTGPKPSRAAEIADHVLRAPGSNTARIQELHLASYHAICELLDVRFSSDGDSDSLRTGRKS